MREAQRINNPALFKLSPKRLNKLIDNFIADGHQWDAEAFVEYVKRPHTYHYRYHIIITLLVVGLFVGLYLLSDKQAVAKVMRTLAWLLVGIAGVAAAAKILLEGFAMDYSQSMLEDAEYELSEEDWEEVQRVAKEEVQVIATQADAEALEMKWAQLDARQRSNSKKAAAKEKVAKWLAARAAKEGGLEVVDDGYPMEVNL